MDASQLIRALQKLNNNHDDKYHVGVYAADTIPNIIRKPAAIIANTDEQDKPGTHWVAMYIPKRGCIEFFDSYGLPPLADGHMKFLNKKGVSFNKMELQSLTSKVCGQFCLCFLGSRMNGHSMRDFQKLFSKNTKSNDHIVRSHVNKIFKHLKKCGGQNCCAKLVYKSTARVY
jgi:hypothetical protein